MRTKKIIFKSDKPNLEILKPAPASKFVPEWFRTMLGVKDGIETVKKCVPFLDSLTVGYTIPLTADVVWDNDKKKFLSQANIEINSDHYITQSDNIPIPTEFDSQPHKWLNSWYIKTPKGYSTMFIHPLNRPDLPFYSFTGIVDTDKHPVIVNFPFVLRKDFSGVIPAGTPIIQAIPFKRDGWDSTVIDYGMPYVYDKEYEVDTPPYSWYKRKWWTKKVYR